MLTKEKAEMIKKVRRNAKNDITKIKRNYIFGLTSKDSYLSFVFLTEMKLARIERAIRLGTI